MLAVKRGEEVEEDGTVEDDVDAASASPALCSGRGQMEGGWARCDYQAEPSSKRQSLALARGSRTRLSRAGYGSGPTSHLAPQYISPSRVDMYSTTPKTKSAPSEMRLKYELTHSANSEVGSTDSIIL